MDRPASRVEAAEPAFRLVPALDDVFRIAFEHSAAGISVAAVNGEYVHANRLYWQLHRSRKANAAAGTYISQTLFLHRMLWKFQGWLNGFNGGPMRRPTMRLNDAQMNLLRQGLIRSGLKPTGASPGSRAGWPA